MKPAYKDPRADRMDQQRDAMADVGHRPEMNHSIAIGAAKKGNKYREPMDEKDFDLSDTPREPAMPRRKGPPPLPYQRPNKKMGAPHQLNPGMPPRKDEATPFGGPERRSTTTTATTAPAGGERRRARSDTSQFQMRPNTPLMKPGASQPVQTEPGEHAWDVYVDGAGVYKVPASDEQTAKQRAAEWLASGGDPEVAGRKFDPSAFQAVRGESSTVGGSVGSGPQRQLSAEGLAIFREMVNTRIKEIVRKKEGGGGYNLYSPNKGKKRSPKPVGEFPTRMAAKRAELARFPPKDPEQLKRARKRLDKLAKDPKKRIDKEKEELRSKGPKRSGKSQGERKSRKESLVRQMAADISERLFREDEVPASAWDERISNLHPDAMSQDKKLHRYHQGMEKASVGALGDSHRILAKALRGLAKVHPGDIGVDPDRGKMFMPVGLDVDGTEVGPIHLYVDGGNVCIEVSQEAREAISALDPVMAKDLRGGLMSFQEDHLPKIDRAKRAWSERDSYLDKLHQKLEKSVGGMSGVELHLARQLMNKRRR